MIWWVLGESGTMGKQSEIKLATSIFWMDDQHVHLMKCFCIPSIESDSSPYESELSSSGFEVTIHTQAGQVRYSFLGTWPTKTKQLVYIGNNTVAYLF